MDGVCARLAESEPLCKFNLILKYIALPKVYVYPQPSPVARVAGVRDDSSGQHRNEAVLIVPGTTLVSAAPEDDGPLIEVLQSKGDEDGLVRGVCRFLRNKLS